MLLGDAIARITSALGFAPCAACQQRQQALNAWHAALAGQSRQLARKQVYILEVRDGRIVPK